MPGESGLFAIRARVAGDWRDSGRYIVSQSLTAQAMKTLDEFSPASPGRAGGVSVLVVDDETAVRRFAVRVLQREGYAVREASDGLEALELIRVEGASLEVVVTDIVMPRLNGVELMQALSVSHPNLPVILMSGYATAALSDLGIVTPCSILTKPFPGDRLLAEVQRCTRRPDRV
jgi:two-component system, cell cycle sensor histidine kinase and response regulator CckA